MSGLPRGMALAAVLGCATGALIVACGGTQKPEKQGPLSPAEQSTLRVLVGQLESVLA